jgi:hypothetical protein
VKIALLFKNILYIRTFFVTIFWALRCRVYKDRKQYYIVHSVASCANISSTRLTFLTLLWDSPPGPRSMRVPMRISVAIRCVPLACNAA